MDAYVWRCPECPTELACDPRIWPLLEESHRLAHRIERSVRELAERLPMAEIEFEVFA